MHRLNYAPIMPISWYQIVGHEQSLRRGLYDCGHSFNPLEYAWLDYAIILLISWHQIVGHEQPLCRGVYDCSPHCGQSYYRAWI